MTLKFIEDCINKKVIENEKFIVFTYFELRINKDLTKNEAEQFLDIAQNKLYNIGYRTYRTGEQYTFNGNIGIVKENELLIAVKNIEIGEINNGRKAKKSKHR